MYSPREWGLSVLLLDIPNAVQVFPTGVGVIGRLACFPRRLIWIPHGGGGYRFIELKHIRASAHSPREWGLSGPLNRHLLNGSSVPRTCGGYRQCGP